MKFAYFALMIISDIICVVDIVIADWWIDIFDYTIKKHENFMTKIERL